MSVSITFNGTIIEDEGDKLAVEAGAEDNNVSSLPTAINNELSTAISADRVGTPTANATFFPTFAQKNGIVSITGATGTASAFFSDSNGALLNGTDTGLTTDDGTKIYLYTSPSDGRVVYGIAQSSPGSINNAGTPNGTLVFAIVLGGTFDASGNLTGDFFVEQYQAIKNPVVGQVDDNDIVHLTQGSLFVSATQEVIFTDFSAAPSGDSLWVGITPSGTASGQGAVDILITGINPNPNAPSAGDRVEVSTNGLGENSQAVDHLEGLRFDFVSNVTIPNSTTGNQPGTLAYGQHVESHGAGWSPVQVNPTKARVNALMSAFNAAGDPQGATYFSQLSSQSQVIIGSVQVFDSNGNLFGTAQRPAAGSGTVALTGGTVTDNNLSVIFNSVGTAEVDGLLSDYRVEFRTGSASMDRFTITNVTPQTNRSFDIGRIVNLDTGHSSADVSLNVQFEDAGPTISASVTGEPTLTTTDPVAPSTSSANGSFAAQFTSSFGADGPASSSSKTYTLSTPGGASGLIDTATGQPVNLSLDSTTGNILGKDTSGDTVFTVSVDSTGKVTLTQSRAVVQGTASSPDTGETVGLTGTNLVVLTATVTDGDGDSAAASLDLTPQLLFKDVGPTITASATGEPTLTTTDPNSGTSTANGAFGAQFTATFNADGPAASNSKTFAFSNVSGVDSGIIDTASGQHVLLSGGGSQITGTAGAGGPTVFTVSVDSSGGVTLTQSRAVVQGTASNPDTGETVGLTGSNKVVLNATVTDGDGDSAAASLDLTPQLLFKDVGPTITASATGEPTLTTTDPSSGTSTANGAFGAQFTATFNADGPAGSNSETFAFSNVSGVDSGLIDTATGQHVLLSGSGSQITGTAGAGGPTVFTVSVDSSGGVTLTQSRAVVQGTGENPDIGETVGLSGTNKVVLTGTATDGDGDKATASLDLTPQLLFKDVGPTITVDNITNGSYATGGSANWSETPNADGFKSLNITLNNYTIDSHSQVVVNSSLGTDTQTDANGNYVFNGTINDDFNGDGVSDAVSFKLTFNPNASTYKIDVTTPPQTIQTFDTSQGSLAAGGPDPVQTLTFSSGPAAGQSIVFFAALPTAPQTNGTVDNPPKDIEDLVGLGQPDLTEAQIQSFLGPPNQIPTLINASTQLNVSTSGIGVSNNNLDTGESFVVNPSQLVDKVTVFIDNSVGGYTPNSEELDYSVYYKDGTVGAPKKVQAADLHPVTSGPAKGGQSFDISDVAGGPQIDAVQLTMVNGTIKIPVIQFSIAQTFTPQSLNMNLTATLTDGDNDTSKQQFAIALA